jgi:hypothetical protein
MRRQPCLLQDLRDIVHEIRMPDLRRRYVDRDFPGGFARIQPGFRLQRRLAQNPQAEIQRIKASKPVTRPFDSETCG